MRSKHSWLTHKFVGTDTSVLQNKFSQGSIKKWENFWEIPSLAEHLFMAVRESFKTQFVPDLQIIVLLLFVVPHTHICASKFCTRPPPRCSNQYLTHSMPYIYNDSVLVRLTLLCCISLHISIPQAQIDTTLAPYHQLVLQYF